MNQDLPVIIFDGICNLCNRSIDFIIKKDKKQLFRFAALQSKFGETVKSKYSLAKNTDSVILLKNDTIFMESDAALEIAGMLSFPYNTLTVFKVIPKKTRDKLYRFIARNRYKWFGKKNTCRVPDSEEKNRFLE